MTEVAHSMTSGAPAASGQGYPWLKHYPADVRWDMKIQPQPLFTLLDRAVSVHGGRTCTNFLGKTTTYREIGALVDRAAAGSGYLPRENIEVLYFEVLHYFEFSPISAEGRGMTCEQICSGF